MKATVFSGEENTTTSLLKTQKEKLHSECAKFTYQVLQYVFYQPLQVRGDLSKLNSYPFSSWRIICNSLQYHFQSLSSQNTREISLAKRCGVRSETFKDSNHRCSDSVENLIPAAVLSSVSPLQSNLINSILVLLESTGLMIPNEERR